MKQTIRRIAGQANFLSHVIKAFNLKDIEEVTRKTGNFKRFPVFVKMLISAITTQSTSVFVDLLTYSDLVFQDF